jgi:ribosomal-protein-serine acetyltransferase
MNFEIKINEKLSLKLRHAEDAEAVFLLTDNNREHLRPWFPWVDATLSSSDSEKFLIDCQEKFEKKTAADFGVWYDGKWIGSMGFHTISLTSDWAEIGYWIAKDYEGKGLMTECVEAMIAYGFNELNLHRIQIKCVAYNIKSKAIPERLGFKLEGTIRENRKKDGEFYDTLTFGLLKNEWIN